MPFFAENILRNLIQIIPHFVYHSYSFFQPLPPVAPINLAPAFGSPHATPHPAASPLKQAPPPGPRVQSKYIASPDDPIWEAGPQPPAGSPTTFGMILAYQRTGSTLIGSLFNAHPHVFYVYEPLDAVYTTMYGTHPGWNVPTDINTYRNGSQR